MMERRSVDHKMWSLLQSLCHVMISMGPVKRAIVFGDELAGAISRDRSRDFSD